MSATPVVLQGTVTPEGTLLLDGTVPLPAGKVSVTVQPVANQQRTEEFLAFVRKIQAIRESHGVKADAAAAIAAARKVRDEFDEQVEETGRLQDECRRRRLEAEAAPKEAQ